MTIRYPDHDRSQAVLIGVGTYDNHDELPHIPAATDNLTDLHDMPTRSIGGMKPCPTAAGAAILRTGERSVLQITIA